ncbi:MAG: succinyl-diaminopimelate desuccinylase [Planctomycetota bacterium]
MSVTRDEGGADLAELSAELLRVASPYGSEGPLAEHVAHWLGQRGVARIVRADDSLAVLPRVLRPGRPLVLLCGHLDTVRSTEPNPVRTEGRRLFGLGASDMKAAVATILDLVARAARAPAHVDLAAILYAREEGPYEASALPAILDAAVAAGLFALPDVALALVMEPTDGRIELGCMGAAQVRVTIAGKAAHAARPWQGVNALEKAAPLLARLAARDVMPREIDGLPWIEVVSATTCKVVPDAINVIPERCEIGLNLRFAPDRTREDVIATLRELVADVGEFEITSFWPSGAVVREHPLLETLSGAVRDALGGLEIGSKQAWTDVGRFSMLGVPAVNFGPGTKAMAHQTGEWVDLDLVERCARGLRTWLWGEGR